MGRQAQFCVGRMGGDYSTFSNESGNDAMDKMFNLLKEEGHEIYFSNRSKKFFIVVGKYPSLTNRYITVKKKNNIYEELTYECFLT